MGDSSNRHDFIYWDFSRNDCGLPAQSYSWGELLTNFSIDNGFYFLLKIISLFTDDWWAARAILFVLTFELYSMTISEDSPYPCVSLLIFIGMTHLSLMLSILRQSLATAICLIAYRQIQKKSWIKCLIMLLLAVTIHKAAIICVFLLFVYILRLKKFSGWQLVIFSLAAYVVFHTMIPIVISLYSNSDYAGVAEKNGGYGMLIFMAVVYVILNHLMHQTRATENHELSYLFNISCGGLFIQIGALQWDLLNRAGAFFTIYWCMLFPKLICQFSRSKRVLYYLIISCLFGFMFFYQLSDVEMFVLHKF